MRKHYLTIIAILLGVGVVHFAVLTRQTQAGRAQMPESIKSIPDRIADFRQIGVDEKVDEKTAAILETTSVLMRDYIGNAGRPVQLTIVYAGATRRSLHFPEVCLVGQGWEIREQTSMPVGILFSAKRLVLVSGQDQQAVLYWFKTGDYLSGNYFVNALYWARNQILSGTPTSSMVKLSTRIGPAGEEAAFAVLEDFALKCQPVLIKHVP